METEKVKSLLIRMNQCVNSIERNMEDIKGFEKISPTHIFWKQDEVKLLIRDCKRDMEKKIDLFNELNKELGEIVLSMPIPKTEENIESSGHTDQLKEE